MEILNLPSFQIRQPDLIQWMIPDSIRTLELVSILQSNEWLFTREMNAIQSKGWKALALIDRTTYELIYLPLVNGIPIPKQISIPKNQNFRYTTEREIRESVVVPVSSLKDSILLVKTLIPIS